MSWKALATFVFCTLALAACGNSKDATNIYVVTPATKASKFDEILSAIAKQHGLDPRTAQITDDKGHTLHVIAADGQLLHLWAQNLPLDGTEPPSICGLYTEAHVDPGQYIITVDYGFVQFGLNHFLAAVSGKNKPQELMLEIGNELKATGYDVRRKPIMCSPLSKLQSRATR